MTAPASWTGQAACTGHDPDMWNPADSNHPGPDTLRRVEEAARVCADCPVRDACAAYGRAERLSGVYAGVLLNAGRPQRINGIRQQAALCGTEAAYKRHCYLGESVDDACRAAHTRYERRRRRGHDNPPPVPQPCGTPAAYKRHRYHGELIDEECEAASRNYRRKLHLATKHRTGESA